MKKLLLASMCMTTLALAACDKKPNENTTAVAEKNDTPAMTTLSNNVMADIKTDLAQLEMLSNTKAQEALSFQTEVTQAAQSGDQKALEGVVDKMEKYMDTFNDDLDALKLKSTEASNLREKMKQSNELGVELAEAGIEKNPNMEKINELQKKGVELQESILKDMQDLQSKVNMAA